MRHRTIAIALVAAPLLTGLGFAFGPGPRAAQPAANNTLESNTFEVDAVHSHILFRTKHLGLAYAHGRFDQFSGQFTLGDTPSIELSIDVTSVDTQSTKRDSHLKGPDFFNSGEHPTSTFKSTKIEKKGDDTFMVTGDLTLLGKTQEVSFEAKKIGEGPDPWEGFRAGLHATVTIQRSDFGMTWGLENGAVGDEVLLEISLEGVRQE